MAENNDVTSFTVETWTDWNLRPPSNLKDFYICPECDAIVYNLGKHMDWHLRMNV